MIVKMNNGYSDRARNILCNFSLLILFYMLPEEAVEEMGLLLAPRNPLKFISDKHYLRIYKSKMFSKRLMQKWGDYIWIFLEVRGYKLNYSKNDPLNMLVHDAETWLEVAKVIGRDVEYLVSQSVAMREIPFWDFDDILKNYSILAKHFWNHPTIQAGEVYNIIKKHRTHEDFSHWRSHVKTDFHRSFNHTQATTKTISYDAIEEQMTRIGVTSHELENIDASDGVRAFIDHLHSKQDKIILQLSLLDSTQAEIAQYVGFANHSAVSKRIAVIRKEYLKYQEICGLIKPSKETIEKYK